MKTISQDLELEGKACSVFMIDFDDSFTFNVVSSIEEFIHQPVRVIHWRDLGTLKSVLESPSISSGLIIWGPGPGHPMEYWKEVGPFLQQCLSNKKIFNYGICLGHQLMGLAQGLKVGSAYQIKHGENVPLTIPAWAFFAQEDQGKNVRVQRYNSLSVTGEASKVPRNCQVLLENNEWVMTSGENYFSCQFHPESAGTSAPEIFFTPLKRFLYNLRDEESVWSQKFPQ